MMGNSRGKMRVLVMLSLLNVAGLGFAQNRLTLEISDQPRPVSEAVQELTRRHGWLICYEDETYRFEGDKENLAPLILRSKGLKPDVNTKPFIGPRLGSISISYDPSSDPLTVLKGVAAEYAIRSGTFFDVRQVGDRFVMAPSKVKDESGKLVSASPLLDTPISLPELDLSWEEALDEIATALTQISGKRVGIGMGPNVFRRVKISAINEPARDVLIRVLAMAGNGNRLVWTLNYDPGIGWYALNLRYAPLKKAN